MAGPEKIEGLSPQIPNLSTSNSTPSRQNPSESISSSPRDTDAVELSPENTEYQQILTWINQEPDIRHNRVERLRQVLESGTYHIDSDSVAHRLLRDSLMDNLTASQSGDTPSDSNTTEPN